MSEPLMLDLYCCQGGASEGYKRAGWRALGVDIDPQPRYRCPFHQGDALKVLDRLLDGRAVDFGGGFAYRLDDFDGAHASPPCQRYTDAQRIQGNDHPDLIGPTRERLAATGLPYVIENVVGAESELLDPVMLCGSMFGLRTYRHRLFEATFPIAAPDHPEHVARQTKMGRPVRDGEFMHVVGNFSGVDTAREVMDMPWANRDGLREAIPPAYTEWIGRQMLAHVNEKVA